MKKHRLTKRILALAAAAVMAVTALAGCGAGGSAGGDTGGSKALDTALEEAEPKVKDYAENQQRYSGLFFDKMLKTAGEAAKLVNADSSQDDLKNAVEKLKLDSVTVANERGLIVACYPEDEKGKTLKESKDKKEFSPLAKGMNVKQMSVPEPADDGSYSLFAGINRGEEGGAVIIGFKTTDYATVTGENLADECGVNTIVLKDDDVLSSTLEKVKAGDKAEDLGIEADDVKKGSLDLKADGTEYKCKAEAIDSFTLICAEPK